MKKFISFSLFLLVIISLAGCFAKQQSEPGQKQAMVQVAISANAYGDKLDATAYDADMALYGAVYEPLVCYQGQGKYGPGLAESWRIEDEGKRYTFHLKSGIKFSDGTDFTGEAVKFTLERAKAKNEASTLETLNNLEKIEVIDPKTVTLYLKKTSNQLLAELSQTRPLRIMSPNAVEGGTITGKFKEAIGTGPFKVKTGSAEEVIMEPNVHYDQGKPVNYGLTFKTIQDSSSRMLALKSGAVDIVGGTLGSLTENDSQLLKSDPAFKEHAFKGTMSYFLGFNPANQTLTKQIRNGIGLALNKEKLSSKKLQGLFRENVQYVTATNQAALPYDLEKAQKLFEAEGYQKNSQGFYEKNKVPLAFKLVIQTTEFPEWKEQAELIEQDLKKAGVKVNITILDSESYYDVLWSSKAFDLIIYRTYTDALLPAPFLRSVFYHTAENKGILAQDAELTRLLDDYAQTSAEGQQQQLFNQIFKRMSTEVLAVPIDYKDEVFVTSKKIKNFSYSGLSDAPIDFKKLQVTEQ